MIHCSKEFKPDELNTYIAKMLRRMDELVNAFPSLKLCRLAKNATIFTSSLNIFSQFVSNVMPSLRKVVC